MKWEGMFYVVNYWEGMFYTVNYQFKCPVSFCLTPKLQFSSIMKFFQQKWSTFFESSRIKIIHN